MQDIAAANVGKSMKYNIRKLVETLNINVKTNNNIEFFYYINILYDQNDGKFYLEVIRRDLFKMNPFGYDEISSESLFVYEDGQFVDREDGFFSIGEAREYLESRIHGIFG